MLLVMFVHFFRTVEFEFTSFKVAFNAFVFAFISVESFLVKVARTGLRECAIAAIDGTLVGFIAGMASFVRLEVVLVERF